MLSHAIADQQKLSKESEQMKVALGCAAQMLINYFDEQLPDVLFRPASFGESNIYRFVQDNKEPHSPCYIISIQIGVLHNLFWDFFYKQCNLNMQCVMTGFLVSQKSLEDAKISREQYAKFIGSFDDLLKSLKNLKPVEHSSYERTLRFI